ncbi:long-chain acyl-CoA synthetase [Rhodoligotrophos appendicifer]|uniref:class I adenylate-forming enzyme family protein n=1 Tax=Rhodoligotrophos appendicifer TaxID=987056 RepID=UPI001185D03F|nr:class I adenylate-forming enzyme family protein [Rhodoligotrophos appendicifer]
MNISSRLQAVAEGTPDRIALRTSAKSLTYGAVVRQSTALAATLANRGVQAGQPLVVLCENSIEIMLFYYAAARLGAVFVPVNQSLSAPEVRFILDHSGASVLYHDEALADVAAVAVEASQRCLISTLFAKLDETTRTPAPERNLDHGDFLVIYTSGSTGIPKAVVFDQAAESAGNDMLAELWGLSPQDVTLVALPMGFLYGLSTAAAAALQAGGEVVILRRFHPGEVLGALQHAGVTLFHGVPTMFAMLLEYAEQNDLDVDLSGLRLLICAGAPLSEELRQRFASRFHKEIDDYYALTEVRPIFGRPWTDRDPVPKGSLGKLAPRVEARVVDGEGRDVAAGAQGELLVRAPSMLKRYHNDEAQTRAALRDGWFKTGDLSRRDAQGYYFLTGRIKDIIIRGGANIAPVEIEEILNSHEAVLTAAVIGVPDAKYGEVPVAYVILRGQAFVTGEDLRRSCAEHLAEFKVPAQIVLLDSLPLGSTGKVDKKALKQMWLDRPATARTLA